MSRQQEGGQEEERLQHEQRQPQQEEEVPLAATAAPTPTPAPPPAPPHHELAPPADLVAAMELAPDGGLVAPPGPLHPQGAGGANHPALPRAARARLAHEQPQALRPSGVDPHAPPHAPVAQLQPLAPQVVESLGAQEALVKGSDAEVKKMHQQQEREQQLRRSQALMGGGGKGNKHVESAAIGPAARGSTQRGPAPGMQGPAPK